MVKLGEGLWLFELGDPKEASRVLRFNRRFRGNILSLKKMEARHSIRFPPVLGRKCGLD